MPACGPANQPCKTEWRRWDFPIVLPLLGLLALYRRWLSPSLPAACRFEPSCSLYATQALCRHAAPRALLLIAWRLLRCQPWCRGGFDPVPGSTCFHARETC